MPTRRMIDPAIWQSYTMADLTHRQRLLFIGLFSNADDQGRLKAHPGIVHSLVFPLDDLAHDDIRRDLAAIQAVGSIFIYNVGGKDYIQITNWWVYQSPQWAYPSQIPAPDGWRDRLRYRKGNQVHTLNWNTRGGFPAGRSPTASGVGPDDRLPDGSPDDQGKALPKEPVDGLPGAPGDGIVQYSVEQDRLAAAAAAAAPPASARPRDPTATPEAPDPTAGERGACALFQQHAGYMTGGIAAELVDLVAETEAFRLGLPRGTPGAELPGDAWVCEAIREMTRAGPDRPNVRYVTQVVNRWRREGFKSGNGAGPRDGNRRGRHTSRAGPDPPPAISGEEAERFRRMMREHRQNKVPEHRQRQRAKEGSSA